MTKTVIKVEEKFLDSIHGDLSRLGKIKEYASMRVPEGIRIFPTL
jgi:hypothetical protein